MALGGCYHRKTTWGHRRLLKWSSSREKCRRAGGLCHRPGNGEYSGIYLTPPCTGYESGYDCDTMLWLCEGTWRRSAAPPARATNPTRCRGGPRGPVSPAGCPVQGPGRPGWHRVRSHRAQSYRKRPLDIQGGGSDLIFSAPRVHRCTRRMSAANLRFARHYVHADRLGNKMSKSRGNPCWCGACAGR